MDAILTVSVSLVPVFGLNLLPQACQLQAPRALLPALFLIVCVCVSIMCLGADHNMLGYIKGQLGGVGSLFLPFC